MLLISSNFREIHSGKISPKLLYRSNHPIYNGKQVKDIVLSAENAKIQTVINLSDSIWSLRSKIIYCPWYKNLFDKNNVIALNMNIKSNASDDKFCKKIRDGLLFIINHNPPYLIHCEAGVDRTGFLSVLLESFMGASFDDIVKDYMLSFVEDSDYSLEDYKNGSMFITNLFGKIKGDAIKAGDDLQFLSVQYFLEKVKLNAREIQMLGNRLAGK
jgi:hypothetical protein